MRRIEVTNVDPELHDRLRARAAAAGVPLGEYVVELIRRDLRTPSRGDWLAQVRSLPSISSDIDIVEALDEARTER